MRIPLAAATLALGTLAACSYRPAPVTLAGDAGSIRALAGTWTGMYTGTESRRTGSITFTIQVAGDSAFGDVLMEAPPGAGVFSPADSPAAHRAHARNAQLLAVRFVVILGGEVSGELEPYNAPDCDCTVRTTFTGYVRADSITGTFLTRGREIGPQTGVWGVARKP
jgi:hypothetical protein